MASLAEKRIADVEERSVDPQARPEELRLLEALLFASDRAARSGDARQAHARRRRHQGRAGAAAGGLRLARRQSGARRQQMDLPHRRRSRLADDAGEHRNPAAVARGDRDAGDHRLSPAGDARGDRGNPRRDHLQGDARRAAGDRLDPSARPPQDAGPSADLRNHGSLSVAVQPRGAQRSAGPRGTERAPACWIRGCRPVSAFRRRRTIRPCATTRIRWRSAIWNWRWRRQSSRKSGERKAGFDVGRPAAARAVNDAG